MKAQRGHSGRIEVNKGKLYVDGLKRTWLKAFRQACEFDGFPPDSTFAAFSNDNPFVVFADKAAKAYWQALREYQAGGYVGLSLRG